MFAEKEIRTNATSVVAGSLWIASVAVWGSAWIFDELYVAGLAVILSAAAGTATVRGYFVAQTEQLRTALRVTGRSGGDADVTPLKR